MQTKTPNFGLGIEGEICGCKANLIIAKESGDWSYVGKLYVQNKGVDELLPIIDKNLAEISSEYSEVIGVINEEAIISHRKDKYYLTIQSGGGGITALSSKDGAVITAEIKKSRVETEEGKQKGFKQAVNEAAAVLGIEHLSLFLRSGTMPLSKLPASTSIEFPQNTSIVSNCSMFVYGKFQFGKSNVLFKEIIGELFGLKDMEMFLAYGNADKAFVCYMMFPYIDNKLMMCKNMYLYLRFQRQGNEFGICGEFKLHFLGNMEFGLDCIIGSKGFFIVASSKAGQRFELIPGFYIQDTALLIGHDTGFTFGLITRLVIRDLELFSGIKLSVQGGATTLSLITAALYELTLPLLLDNLLGFHIPGVETLDFIQICSFDLKLESRYQGNQDIVEYINQNAIDESWRLDKERTQIRKQKKGVSILDESRMCHYYIDHEGVLSLQAQFYYATENCRLGTYEIKKGIFICAVLTIFGKKMKALLSMKEGEGIIAFAQIEEMDLGYLKISPSTVGSEMRNPMLADGNTMLAKFVEPTDNSAVFFLSANKKDVSFYLDGRIEICRIFSVDARIIYMQGNIAADVKFELMKVLEVHLKLEVQYGNFLNGNFKFILIVDERKLEEKLKAVKKNINNAIEKCRKAVQDAEKHLDDAKARVNGLYCEISSLDSKIEGCRRTIRNTSKWKRWIVAIYKGAEILAYEVAKGALYVAIGTAKAALEVAKAAVQFGGILGEGVLQIAKGVVTAALNIFFLRRIELRIAADKNAQSIGGRIEFVALGKEYAYDAVFGTGLLKSGRPEDAIADNINGKMEKDLENIDKGAFKSNRDKYQRQEDLRKGRKHLQIGIGEMQKAVGLISDIQDIYVNGTKEIMPEFETMNGEYERAIAGIENTMTSIAKHIKLDELENPMQTLDKVLNEGAEIDREKAKETLAHYKEAKLSFEQLKENIKEIQKMKAEAVYNYQGQRRTADNMMQAGEQSEGDVMEDIVNSVEETMCTVHFRVTPQDSGYINLSKEKAIAEYFREYRKEKGYEVPKSVGNARGERRTIRYTDRI